MNSKVSHTTTLVILYYSYEAVDWSLLPFELVCQVSVGLAADSLVSARTVSQISKEIYKRCLRFIRMTLVVRRREDMYCLLSW